MAADLSPELQERLEDLEKELELLASFARWHTSRRSGGPERQFTTTEQSTIFNWDNSACGNSPAVPVLAK
ncbi:hypothetical protein VPNG_00829 [Cytospora leucostoma]|uniref:Uncharacterized protein n=1 Tax=Cytospora leucostoma TaxID=1230097 RepID=A0A423XMY9_9PEZI|nr:hypothetical protein VPNG_00829 [Cytospora leucostoma]